MSKYDVVIKDGVVFDGLRNPRVAADIGIRDGRIASIGSLDAHGAKRVLNADGLHVAPGFIDLHTHYDSQLFWDPYCSASGWHGVTTVVIGNCGYGFAPCRIEDRERTMLGLTRTEAVPLPAMKAGIPWDWVTFPEFIASVRRTRKSVNVAINVPINPLMIWVMGFERAKSGALPTDSEHNEMARLLNEAMDAGAIGLSAARLGDGSNHPDFDGTPMPTDLMHDETMFVFADVLRKRNQGVIQYTYADLISCLPQSDSRFADAKKARLHVEEIARRSGRGVLMLPFDVTGGLDWVKECQEKGMRVHAQRGTIGICNYSVPFNLAEHPIFLGSNEAWRSATTGTTEEIKRKLSDQNIRTKLRTLFSRIPLGKWVLRNGITPETSKFNAMSLNDIAQMLGGKDLTDTFLDITIAADLKSDWTIYSAEVCDLRPYQSIAGDHYWVPGVSDGGAHVKFINLGHYGTLFLTTYVREYKWLSLEDAHYRLSALPAYIAGLEEGIGTLTVGAPADIIVYNFDQLGITAQEKLCDYPAGEWRLATRGIGYRWVLVNGEITIDDDKETRIYSGRVVHSSRGELAEELRNAS